MDKILRTQNKILRHQDMIFDRLRDLEEKYRVLSETSTSSHQSVYTTNYSGYPKSQFPLPSPEWYKGMDEDDLQQPHQSYHQQPQKMPHVQPNITKFPVTPQSRLSLHQPVRALPQPTLNSQQIRAAPLSPTEPMNAPQPPSTSQQIQAAPRLSQTGTMAAPILPLPINKMKGPTMESASIDKANLLAVETVIEKYKSLKNVGSAGALAVKLARESFFGQDVLAHCTVYGHREQPGLPKAELFQLKQTMFGLFPQYWATPAQFETVWNSCITSINQCCKRLRKTLPITDK